MSDEQGDAVRHITGEQQVSVVVGFAGAGKSTMLAAAKDAWEAEGYTVHGAALAGKAVAGLEESAGIEGRTLASWEMRWKMGTAQLGPRDVMVIDEAGMVGSRQLASQPGLCPRQNARGPSSCWLATMSSFRRSAPVRRSGPLPRRLVTPRSRI